MNNDLFSNVRMVANVMALRNAEAERLHVDLASLKLIPQSAPFSWVASFDACTRGGKSTQFFVNVSANADRTRVVARIPYMNDTASFDLVPFTESLPARPKSQGQLIGEAVYANWLKARGAQLAAALSVVARAASYVAQSDVTTYGGAATLLGLALSGLCFVGLVCRTIWKP